MRLIFSQRNRGKHSNLVESGGRLYKLRVVPNYCTENKKRRRPGEIHALRETRRARKARAASRAVQITRVRVSVSRRDLRLLVRSRSLEIQQI